MIRFPEGAFSIGLAKTSKVDSTLNEPECISSTQIVGIDSSLSDNFGRSVMYGLSAATTLITISAVGGLPFILAALVLGSFYYNGTHYFRRQYLIFIFVIAAKVYGQTSRDMRRLGNAQLLDPCLDS